MLSGRVQRGETAQANPVSDERSNRDERTGPTSSASISSVRALFPKCSATATMASLSPAPPLTLVHANTKPRLRLPRPG